VDKVIYFLAGLVIGHVISQKLSKQESPFVAIPANIFQQIQEQSQKASEATKASNKCTFRCWLCDGATTFQHPNGEQFQVECTRCGVENLIRIPS